MNIELMINGKSGIRSGIILYVPVPRSDFPLKLARMFHSIVSV